MSESVKPAPTEPGKIWQNAYMAIKRCRHGTFLYNINETFFGRSLDLYGEWCKAELSVLGQRSLSDCTAAVTGFCDETGPRRVWGPEYSEGRINDIEAISSVLDRYTWSCCGEQVWGKPETYPRKCDCSGEDVPWVEVPPESKESVVRNKPATLDDLPPWASTSKAGEPKG